MFPKISWDTMDSGSSGLWALEPDGDQIKTRSCRKRNLRSIAAGCDVIDFHVVPPDCMFHGLHGFARISGLRGLEPDGVPIKTRSCSKETFARSQLAGMSSILMFFHVFHVFALFDFIYVYGFHMFSGIS